MAREQIASGREAVERTANALKNPIPWTFTDTFGTKHTLNPGDVWGDMMFVGKHDGVYYTQGKYLYKLDAGTFIRDIYVSAVAKGVAKAEWLVPILKAEMTFCMALVGSMAAIVGTIAAVTVGVGKGVSFYVKHRGIIQVVTPLLKKVLAGLKYFKTKCPKLYKFLRNVALKKAASSIPDSVSGDDIAYLLGKLLGGLASGSTVGFTVFAKVLAKSMGVLLALRGVPMAARGSAKNVKEFVQKVKEGGVTITEVQAKEILQETCVADKVNEQQMKKMIEAAEKAQPHLQTLAAAAKDL